MGTDIYARAVYRSGAGWLPIDLPRNYALFGWLADVRNYSAIPPLKGVVPAPRTLDADSYAEGFTWFVPSETLREFDYDQPVEDRRVTLEVSPGFWDGGCTCEPGKGTLTTYRALFGDGVVHTFQTLPKESNFWFGFD